MGDYRLFDANSRCVFALSDSPYTRDELNMSNVAEKISGGCLCGEVRFKVPVSPTIQTLCFCSDCQKISGSSSYSAYLIPLDQLVLIKGLPLSFTVKSDAGRNNCRKFCGNCGSRLWAELEFGLASVNGMAFDEKRFFNPTHNHRLENAPDWCRVDKELETLS